MAIQVSNVLQAIETKYPIRIKGISICLTTQCVQKLLLTYLVLAMKTQNHSFRYHNLKLKYSVI